MLPPGCFDESGQRRRPCYFVIHHETPNRLTPPRGLLVSAGRGWRDNDALRLLRAPYTHRTNPTTRSNNAADRERPTTGSLEGSRRSAGDTPADAARASIDIFIGAERPFPCRPDPEHTPSPFRVIDADHELVFPAGRQTTDSRQLHRLPRLPPRRRQCRRRRRRRSPARPPLWRDQWPPKTGLRNGRHGAPVTTTDPDTYHDAWSPSYATVHSRPSKVARASCPRTYCSPRNELPVV